MFTAMYRAKKPGDGYAERVRNL